MSAIATHNGNDTDITRPRRTVVVVEDTGPFANLLDTGKFEHLWRVSQLFADSEMVPAHFRGHPSDCFIITQMAIRLGIDPFMLLQNTYIVHGKPGMEAKIAIALINSSGLFTGSLAYEVEGDDAHDPKYRVRAFATRKDSRTPIHGPWVDWKIVKAEGWLDKAGSKWKTMPAIMFQYCAATFFGRLHCPERLMGMSTSDELHDASEARRIESRVVNAPSKSNDLNDALAAESQIDPKADDVSQLPDHERKLPEPAAAAEPDVPEHDNAPEESELGRITLKDFQEMDWPATEKLLRDKAKDAGITSRQIYAGMKFKVWGSSDEASTPQQRYELFRAIIEGRVNKATGAVAPA